MSWLPKSIRWRLQLWYGVFLLLVLAGFGLTAYQLQRGKQFRRLDDELQRRAAEVASNFRPPGPRGRGLLGPPMQDGPPDRRPPFDDPGPGARPGPPRPGENPDPLPRRPGEFHLGPQQDRLFDESDTNGFYYVVWARDGLELSRSTNAPASVSRPSRPGTPLLRGPHPPQMRGTWREVSLFMPPGEIVLAGCSVSPELAELQRTAWLLAGTGGVILLLGLAGGGWMAVRAIRPIEDISAAAVKIASGDLSQRINLAETESELGRLGAVLNSTFTRLEAAFGQQKQFASDAAHELRTPVSVVLTQTQTALSRNRDAAQYRETLEACQRAAQRMRGLIESLLELARLDAGQEPMKKMAFDFSSTAQECVELIRPLAEEHGVRIACDLPGIQCVGDPQRLAQVITNLLTNAVRHGGQGAEIRVSAKGPPGVVFTVADTGPGISAEHLPHIFDRFYRVDESRSVGGSGLGLAISKAIVAAHGGVIEAASNPGQGTVFTVRLPG